MKDRMLIALIAVLACVGVGLMVIGFGGVGRSSPEPTATKKPGLSTILKVSPIGTEPVKVATIAVATAAPLPATASPVIVSTAITKPSSAAAPIGQGFMCPNGTECVKGNINDKKAKIYHLPGCPSYEKTVIKPEDGERMFASEADAVAAGWSKASNCN